MASASFGWTEGVRRGEVFPFHELGAEDRATAETWLRDAMDSEALYTIIGGMKPMSSGFASVRVKRGEPLTEAAARGHRIARAFRVGGHLSGALIPYARAQEGTIFLDAYVFHRAAFAAEVKRKADLFALFGVSEATDPALVVSSFERDETTARFRAFGHLFGYPEAAVDFFARAADTQRADPEKKLVPRDFLSIPTFARETNAFVYAVPKGHTPTGEDLALRAQAAPILAEYRRLRPQYLRPGGGGILSLVRDWMCDPSTLRCSPEIALKKTEHPASQ